MQIQTRRSPAARRALEAVTFAAFSLPAAHADVITDWNLKTGELIAEAKMGTPPAVRVMAIVQTAVSQAVDASTQRAAPTAAGASLEAAVAAAHRATLTRLLPAQQAAIDAAYQAALTTIADGPAKTAGVTVGERAALDVLARRTDDAPSAGESYRPHTSAGAYVPTGMPAVPHWPQRRPWLMTSATQFRPGPPPALTSERWARDYNEVKELGGKTNTRRSAEQTEIARFWEYSLPSIYYGVLRSVALQPGRDPARNARLFAVAAQAMDDGLISGFDAKYHYNFWRPSTAIRNGDIDGHDATQRDAAWSSLVDAPMHPDYPSGHSILVAAVGAVLKAEVGAGPMPALTTSSPSAKGTVRRWTSVDELVREVSDARVYAGIHFRAATEAGAAIGKQVGELAAAKQLHSPH